MHPQGQPSLLAAFKTNQDRRIKLVLQEACTYALARLTFICVLPSCPHFLLPASPYMHCGWRVKGILVYTHRNRLTFPVLAGYTETTLAEHHKEDQHGWST